MEEILLKETIPLVELAGSYRSKRTADNGNSVASFTTCAAYVWDEMGFSKS